MAKMYVTASADLKKAVERAALADHRSVSEWLAHLARRELDRLAPVPRKLTKETENEAR